MFIKLVPEAGGSDYRVHCYCNGADLINESTAPDVYVTSLSFF